MSFWEDKSCFFSILAENLLNCGENGTIDLIFNYLEKIKNAKNLYGFKNFCRIFFFVIICGPMRLFETGFRIFIFAMVISESVVDLGYLISQTEVYKKIVYPPKDSDLRRQILSLVRVLRQWNVFCMKQ